MGRVALLRLQLCSRWQCVDHCLQIDPEGSSLHPGASVFSGPAPAPSPYTLSLAFIASEVPVQECPPQRQEASWCWARHLRAWPGESSSYPGAGAQGVGVTVACAGVRAHGCCFLALLCLGLSAYMLLLFHPLKNAWFTTEPQRS